MHTTGGDWGSALSEIEPSPTYVCGVWRVHDTCNRTRDIAFYDANAQSDNYDKEASDRLLDKARALMLYYT